MNSAAAWFRFSGCASRRPKKANGQTVAAQPKPSAPPPDAELLDDELNDDLNF